MNKERWPEVRASLRSFSRGFAVERLDSFRVVALEKVIQTLDGIEEDAWHAVEDGTDPEGDGVLVALDVRTGILNLLAVFLWHTFESQPELRHDPALPDAIAELRDAANAIKHGAGPAAKRLFCRRPDLFRSPYWRDSDGKLSESEPLRDQAVPLAGEGIYVGPEDLSRWLDAVVAYWQDGVGDGRGSPAPAETTA
ncbi:MAG: hypothetical protein OXH32_01590 [Acidobacteria bacterium]|nr:hypothetical protein [Acidobacteriota bacterium]